MSGLESDADEEFIWDTLTLSVGDKVEFEVVETDNVTIPNKVFKNESADLILKAKLDAYNKMKLELEEKGLI
ncbi:hypothetical protein [Marinigracilibium pacificum]|uniref:Uncharacterized protein n=1 Tax=Marinigracilibium pacificum TaxID=2729599 RepID=A0A848J1T6_9BACT|nr:hypothetical protein [Marinigracilibium pacificum]NMM49766.1 hypothetical protein [Marinigracilibium pacificum]